MIESILTESIIQKYSSNVFLIKHRKQKPFNHMILVMQAHSLLEHGGFPELVR